jgi:hypothetical protein
MIPSGANSLAVHPINSFEDERIVAVKKLIDSVKEISSQDSYKLVDGHFNELERLRDAVTK